MTSRVHPNIILTSEAEALIFMIFHDLCAIKVKTNTVGVYVINIPKKKTEKSLKSISYLKIAKIFRRKLAKLEIVKSFVKLQACWTVKERTETHLVGVAYQV